MGGPPVAKLNEKNSKKSKALTAKGKAVPKGKPKPLESKKVAAEVVVDEPIKKIGQG